MPERCSICHGRKLVVLKASVGDEVCGNCGATGLVPTSMEVLRKIMDGHKACKNECSLLGELENWMRAYEGKTLGELKEGAIHGS